MIGSIALPRIPVSSSTLMTFERSWCMRASLAASILTACGAPRPWRRGLYDNGLAMVEQSFGTWRRRQSSVCPFYTQSMWCLIPTQIESATPQAIGLR
ncbi:hypothetical protein BU25DRAFT_413194 [Macroventuria anomochaeta]|uniref:Uncharacterized protein n=1 Tax=Macroventuria anomochaeta TaxID=301207 RepID=A0ACB6RRW7_9PLEO|nr:uncharacterized protein BU25DRAFT_413194 [Macroventuria anomochaeta]KAF2624646.1 hypothetical protein BU25DRAFT_413194 [Macroventuria anomochaeta]